MHAGYDNAISLGNFDESDVLIVQDNADKNLKELTKKYQAYNSMQQFEFLPGHKKLLLSLPKKIEEYLKEKAKENLKRDNAKVADSSAEPVFNGLSDLNGDQKSAVIEKLLSKINKSVLGFELTGQFTEKDIVSEIVSYKHSTSKKLAYRCTVKCIFCEKIFPCTLNGYWQISNFEKHIKSHKQTPEQTSNVRNSIPEKSSNTQPQPNFGSNLSVVATSVGARKEISSNVPVSIIAGSSNAIELEKVLSLDEY